MPPWEVTGEQLTRWRRMVWRFRMELFLVEQNARIERDREEMRVNQQLGQFGR